MSMSNHLRGKSTRKEAIWRQQTLLAAFTSTGAKTRINTAAGTVIEEIVNAIKHFTDPKEEEAIKVAVRRIVKIAAETWRFARLEREMIVAKMPAVDDEDHEYTGPEYWPAYKFESASESRTEEESSKPALLLRLFPVIHREPIHECFQKSEGKQDEGYVFSRGLALYNNAKPILERTEELQQAGLPPPTHPSPTAAEFPPPMIPPPRNPLPAAPVAMDSPIIGALSPHPIVAEMPAPSTKGDSPKDKEIQEETYPTPPRSRPGTPPSPLFAAMDEIDALKQHSSRAPSSTRRSGGNGASQSSSEDLRRVETLRRTSGYSISRSSMETGTTTKTTDSRYWSDGRSAALKALYPNQAIPPPMERAHSLPTRPNSLRSQKRNSQLPLPSRRENESTWGSEDAPSNS